MDIYYVVDKSGSMISRKAQILEGMNEFLLSQRSSPTSRISVYTFSNDVDILWERKTADSSLVFQEEQYEPSGATALLDAIGTIVETKIEWIPDRQILLVILTDGEDNCSFRYTKFRIRQLLEQHQSQLQVVFVGSNQNDVLLGGEASLEYRDVHLSRALEFTTRAIRRFQTQETPSIQFTTLERQQTMEW